VLRLDGGPPLSRRERLARGPSARIGEDCRLPLQRGLWHDAGQQERTIHWHVGQRRRCAAGRLLLNAVQFEEAHEGRQLETGVRDHRPACAGRGSRGRELVAVERMRGVRLAGVASIRTRPGVAAKESGLRARVERIRNRLLRACPGNAFGGEVVVAIAENRGPEWTNSGSQVTCRALEHDRHLRLSANEAPEINVETQIEPQAAEDRFAR